MRNNLYGKNADASLDERNFALAKTQSAIWRKNARKPAQTQDWQTDKKVNTFDWKIIGSAMAEKQGELKSIWE